MADRFIRWLRRHDPGYAALRRAGRTAIVMPGLFALDFEVFHNAEMAVFSAFGSIALLMFADFSGPMRNRLEAEATLAVTGVALICLGTIAAQSVWSAVLLMAVVAFTVILLGVVSSVLAGSMTALLLVFILPDATQAPLSTIPDRLAGWGLAAGVALLAVRFLWPAPERLPLRTDAAAACRALAAHLSPVSDAGDATADHAPRAAAATATTPDTLEAVATLQRQYLSTQWRPTGLGASDRAIVRLVDEISWMNTVVNELDDDPRSSSMQRLALDAHRASANVLVESATLLETRSASIAPLTAARGALAAAMSEVERHFEQHLSMTSTPPADAPISPTSDSPVARFFASLEFSFRSREVGYAAERIATDVERAIRAERRRFFDRLLGHETGDTTPLASARLRIASHLHRHSVWLHNSVRGAVGLSLAVLIAEEISAEHAFWVILGTLSVLRSNALNTGQNALRAIAGTLIGFIVGAGIVELVGTNVTLLWFLFPVALLIAGFAPTAISYAAGQAGFTLTLVILYNIVQPVGWRVGLVRLEDIAIGTAVSAGVALLFWPRGAAAELGAALHDAYTSSVEFLSTAASGAQRALTRTPSPQSSDDRERASAASRRLDDAFRTYLSERGAKPVPLSNIATLVSGVSTLHFSADAVADLWERHANDEQGWREARERLNDASTSIVEWYDEFATRFEGENSSKDLSPQVSNDSEVIRAVREQLTRTRDPDLAEAVRILWTADYLVATQRLEASVIDASRVAETLWIPPNHRGPRGRRRSPEVVAQL
jgi:uncharacterized membrane protein YccC